MLKKKKTDVNKICAMPSKPMPTLMSVAMSIFIVNVARVDSKCLVREPPDTFAPPQETDAGFYVSVNGDPDYYEAGQLYTVSLRVRR